jgi:hypothetical protein
MASFEKEKIFNLQHYQIAFLAFQANESFIPCASAIKDFTSCFLFSLETQHTIGYGVRWEKLAIQILNSNFEIYESFFYFQKKISFSVVWIYLQSNCEQGVLFGNRVSNSRTSSQNTNKRARSSHISYISSLSGMLVWFYKIT